MGICFPKGIETQGLRFSFFGKDDVVKILEQKEGQNDHRN